MAMITDRPVTAVPSLNRTIRSSPAASMATAERMNWNSAPKIHACWNARKASLAPLMPRLNPGKLRIIDDVPA